MKALFAWTFCHGLVGLSALVAIGGVAFAGGPARVEICHLPPGNPDNYQSLTVAASAVPAHLAHGDLLGACRANCDILCDDGDACTDPDGSPDAASGRCVCAPLPVVCDDDNDCTDDWCDPGWGACVFAPVDGAACTSDGAEGVCAEGDCVVSTSSGCRGKTAPVFALSTASGMITACPGSFDGQEVFTATTSALACDAGWHICRGDDPAVWEVSYATANTFPGCYAFNARHDCNGCFRTCDDHGGSINGWGGCDDNLNGADMAGMGTGCTGQRNVTQTRESCLATGRLDASTNTFGCYLVASLSGVMCCSNH